MNKLDLKRAGEPEIKLPTSVRSYRKQGIPKKPISASLATLKSLIVWITTNWKILKEMEITDHLICVLRNLYVEEEVTELDMEQQQTGSKWGKEYIVTLLI